MEDAKTTTTQTIKVDDDSSSASDDSDTLERMRAFSASAGGNNRTTKSESSGPSSVRRYDEYASFLTRSQRAHMLGKENPLNKEEESKHKVHFIIVSEDDDVLEIVHELPELTDEDKHRCFMTAENWESIDTDIELMRKRWDNHVSGRLPLDTINNSIRGLETILDIDCSGRNMVPEHEKNVINESNRQKREKEYIHWDKFRQVSLNTSAAEAERVRKLGLHDEAEAVQCWQPNVNRTSSSSLSSIKDDKKRPSLFKKIFGGSKSSQK